MSKSKPELKLVEDTGSQLQDEDLSIELPPQQSEMPFAVVEGEPVTQLPRDLYIPPDALQVFLTAFEGPLDLLLYLIRKQNLDILNIPIAEITRQYMQYIEVMADLQLELAGEYLLMAAMLAEIKSRMLLPRPATVEGQEEEDPRAELVRRLQEYERFKKAAEDIDRLKRLERDTMPASAELEERKVVARPPDVTLKEMLDAFRDVLARAEKFAHHHISRERLSQRERMSEILARLQTAAFFEFTQLFKPEEGRMGVTVTFIAILELMKEGLIEIVQAEAYAPIHVRQAQRHLKVVQGGAASEAADAENVAALAQPELAGENDIPDEDDETPPADEAATAVEAAVADVAVASAIAVDSVEAGEDLGDAAVVEAAVSEALASTDNAVETVAEVAEVTVVTDVAAEPTEPAESLVTVEEPAVIEEQPVEEHVVPEHVVEEHEVPEPSIEPRLEQNIAPAETVAEVVGQAAPEQLADESVESEQPAVTIEASVEDAPALESIEVVAEDVAPSEPDMAEPDTTELAAEPEAAIVENSIDQPSIDQAASEQASEDPTGELSVADDTVTGASSEADNSDPESSR
ncbi:MAG TPA: segregation/condensation protein A [Steroidobacter sp.]